MRPVELIPNWNVNEKLIYKIWRKEDFQFKDSKSPAFERNYHLELRLLEDNIVEAYFPNSLLSTIKLTNSAHPYFSKINDALQNTIYYEIDDYYRVFEIKNLEQLIDNISKIKSQLKNILPSKLFEEIEVDLETLESSPDYAQKKFLEDIEVIHEFYGSDIYDGYFFDLDKNESVSKKVKKKLLNLIKLDFGKIDIFQTDFLNEDLYQIELLKGKDTISTMNRKNFETIREIFLNHEFEMKNFDDVTLNHQRFIYDIPNCILKSYDYHFMIDTPNMKKHMQSRIELIY